MGTFKNCTLDPGPELCIDKEKEDINMLLTNYFYE